MSSGFGVSAIGAAGIMREVLGCRPQRGDRRTSWLRTAGSWTRVTEEGILEPS